MKVFNYQGRTKDGAQTTGELQALDRKDAIHRLNMMGIVTLSLSPAIARKSLFASSKYFNTLTLAFSVGIAVICAVFFWWFFNIRPDSLRTAKKTNTKSSIVTNTKIQKSTVAQRKTVPVEIQSNQTVIAKNVVGSKNNKTNPGNEMPSTEHDPALKAAQEASDTSLKTLTENVLSLMSSVPPDLPMPPMPVLPEMEKDFKASLTNIIEIRTNDTPEIAERKEKVAWAKYDMSLLVKEGHKPEDIISAMEAQHNDNATLRSNYLSYINELQKAGKEEEAKAFLEAANKELEKAGSPPLKISRTRLEKQ
jgi:hypothetical protein